MILPNTGGKVGHRRTHIRNHPPHTRGGRFLFAGTMVFRRQFADRCNVAASMRNCRVFDRPVSFAQGSTAKGDSGRRQTGAASDGDGRPRLRRGDGGGQREAARSARRHARRGPDRRAAVAQPGRWRHRPGDADRAGGPRSRPTSRPSSSHPTSAVNSSRSTSAPPTTSPATSSPPVSCSTTIPRPRWRMPRPPGPAPGASPRSARPSASRPITAATGRRRSPNCAPPAGWAASQRCCR